MADGHSDRHGDDPHRGGRAEGCSEEKGNRAVQKEGNQDENGRLYEIGSERNDVGNRSRSAPHTCQHADQHEDDEDGADGHDALPCHGEDIGQAVLLIESVPDEKKEACAKRIEEL